MNKWIIKDRIGGWNRSINYIRIEQSREQEFYICLEFIKLTKHPKRSCWVWNRCVNSCVFSLSSIQAVGKELVCNSIRMSCIWAKHMEWMSLTSLCRQKKYIISDWLNWCSWVKLQKKAGIIFLLMKRLKRSRVLTFQTIFYSGKKKIDRFKICY